MVLGASVYFFRKYFWENVGRCRAAVGQGGGTLGRGMAVRRPLRGFQRKDSLMASGHAPACYAVFVCTNERIGTEAVGIFVPHEYFQAENGQKGLNFRPRLN